MFFGDTFVFRRMFFFFGNPSCHGLWLNIPFSEDLPSPQECSWSPCQVGGRCGRWRTLVPIPAPFP
jgi:hypothetical protein